MDVPALHLIAGPNGAGKSTFAEHILARRFRLPFINADLIAAQNWPEDAEARSYDAARMAANLRDRFLRAGRSFVTETVFSHPSKLDLIDSAKTAGFHVTLHVILVPEALSVARVGMRVRHGGHAVPEEKIRQRYERLWRLVREAIGRVDAAYVRDNSRAAEPFRVVAKFRGGRLIGNADWPAWTPEDLLARG